MKITFITGHLCKERHALLNELALDLGENGAKVTVISGYPSRRITKEVQDYYLEHPIEQISPNVIVRRVGSRKGEGTGLLERMVKYILLTINIYRVAKHTSTDVFFIYSSPPFLGYLGNRLVKIAPTLYNAQDLFPETLIHMKHLAEKNLMALFFRAYEKRVYKKSTKIVTLSEEMKNTIASTGCPKEKIEVIYNWADTENLHHIERCDNRLFDELGIEKNKFIISYAGDIGLFQGWDIMLEAAKELMLISSSVLFVFIGSGSYKKRLEERVSKENIGNVRVFPLQSSDRLSEVYSIGDLELVPIEKGITKMAFPSKTGVIMATGSPILALVDNGSDIDRIISENKTGISLEHGDAKKIVEAIRYCISNREQLVEWGGNARTFAKLNFSRKFQTKKYFEILKSISK